MSICEGCHLPEDGLRVRNVAMRKNGEGLCADCAQIKKEEEKTACLSNS